MTQIVLKASKETPHTLRWDAHVGEVLFSFYMPKWVVPTPWPAEISVYVDEIPGPTRNEGRVLSEAQKSIPNASIYTIVKHVVNCGKTSHYRPIGEDKESWEIGEPYIPFDLLPDGQPNQLLIAVEWLQSGTANFRQD